MIVKMIPSKLQPNLPSYTNATWQDVKHVEHKRYIVRAMKPGPGFEIIDTSNYANWSVVSNFATETDALERMHSSVEFHCWRRPVG
jgi:hypothetical protein